jgi:hypothetical protein
METIYGIVDFPVYMHADISWLHKRIVSSTESLLPHTYTFDCRALNLDSI